MQNLAENLVEQLGLEQAPVAVSFLDAPPEKLKRAGGTAPAGCAFWRRAADGEAFWTAPEDHYNCAIGCHTHNIPLPQARAGELDETLGLMTDNGYLRMHEVPGIAQLARTPGAIVYAPLVDAPVPADVVLVVGPAARLMLLQEAAQRAGIECNMPLLGRPTCMALPAALQNGVTASLGCVGNRVYTDAGEGNLYLAIPADDLPAVVDALAVIVDANAQLRDYHTDRKERLTQP